MTKPSTFLAAAAIAYIAMIAFVRLHPTGRDFDLLDFKAHRTTAVVTSLCMLAISALYLFAKKEQDGGKTIRVGCLGIFLAFAA